MGGFIFFILVVVIILVMGYRFMDKEMIILYLFIVFGFIGFLDDMLKIIYKDNLGLKVG